MKNKIIGIAMGIMVVFISILSYQIYKIAERVNKHEADLYSQNGIVPFLSYIQEILKNNQQK